MATQERMTTELGAVNAMLAAVGEAPLNTLVGNFPAGIQIAIDLLRQTSRQIQSVGWNFNTEDDFELSINQSGEVELPGNTLDVDLTIESGEIDIVQRGLRLYDKQNHTYTFTVAPRCTLITMLPWDELNQPARQYIMTRAARIYQDQTVGSGDHHVFSMQDEQVAYQVLQGSNAENEDATIWDSWDVASIVRRKRPQTVSF